MPKKTPARREKPPALDGTRLDLLTPRQKERTLSVLIRHPGAFAAVRDNIKPKHIGSRMGPPYQLVWDVVLKFHKRYGVLPAKHQLLDQVADRVARDATVTLSPEEEEEVADFIVRAFDKDVVGANLHRNDAECAVAIVNCSHLLNEYSAIKLKSAIMDKTTIPADMVAVLRETEAEIAAASSLASPKVDLLFPDGWDDQPALVVTSTRIPMFDKFFGGWVPGEVYVFMGPYGSCKTLVGVQAVAHMLEYCAEQYSAGNTGGRLPVVFLISTEMDRRELQRRLLACVGVVPVDRLLSTKVSDLDDSNEPGAIAATQYEKERMEHIAGAGVFRNEKMRTSGGAALANRHLVYIDATDSNVNEPGLGGGGVAEIAAKIGAWLRDNPNAYPVLFALDHAKALADKIHASQDLKPEHMRGTLGRIPFECGQLLAKKYDAPFLLLHQLSGEANSRKPTAKISHTDADECKSFAQYADFAIQTGNVTEDGRRLCIWRCTKHRRMPPTGTCIVHVDGRFGRVEDKSSRYVVTPGEGSIVTVEEYESLETPEIRARRKSLFSADGKEVLG